MEITPERRRFRQVLATLLAGATMLLYALVTCSGSVAPPVEGAAGTEGVADVTLAEASGAGGISSDAGPRTGVDSPRDRSAAEGSGSGDAAAAPEGSETSAATTAAPPGFAGGTDAVSDTVPSGSDDGPVSSITTNTEPGSDGPEDAAASERSEGGPTPTGAAESTGSAARAAPAPTPSPPEATAAIARLRQNGRTSDLAAGDALWRDPGALVAAAVTAAPLDAVRVRIDSDPSGATVWIGGVRAGSTPLDIRLPATGLAGFRIEMDAGAGGNRYLPREGLVDLSRDVDLSVWLAPR